MFNFVCKKTMPFINSNKAAICENKKNCNHCIIKWINEDAGVLEIQLNGNSRLFYNVKSIYIER